MTKGGVSVMPIMSFFGELFCRESCELAENANEKNNRKNRNRKKFIIANNFLNSAEKATRN
ncbi:hypothetical protein [Mesonia maritima]|uniref:Uncharacterized protein n=1 Tax=Mesonia maritima TaxID=1793873 RepID=A0ABU1KAG8_9FLAO|nr:hypothetical protein [Mesonia maritima]MDR6302245.1 hypothetical protein [Mesonia maritima]